MEKIKMELINGSYFVGTKTHNYPNFDIYFGSIEGELPKSNIFATRELENISGDWNGYHCTGWENLYVDKILQLPSLNYNPSTNYLIIGKWEDEYRDYNESGDPYTIKEWREI